MKILSHTIEPYNPLSVMVTASIENNGVVYRHQVIYSNIITVDKMLEFSLKDCCEFVIREEIRRYLKTK